MDSMKFLVILEGVGLLIKNIRLNFGTDPDPVLDLDQGYFFHFSSMRDRAFRHLI